MEEIERVGVVGCGLMGSGIAEICARAGLETLVTETNEQLLAQGRARIERSFERAARAGKLSGDEHDEALSRLSFTTDIDSFADREMVFEAVAELEEVKTEVFRRLDAVIGDSPAVLASNTSSIPIISLGMATSRPERVLGVHFFNPVPVLPLVEIIPSLRTAEEVTERAEALVGGRLKKVLVRSGDRAGFVVNALLVPFLLSAVRMYESGFASAEDIDRGLEAGCAHPMGPLRLSDFVGLDTLKSVADVMFAEFKEPLYAAPPLLARMVDAGYLGKKSGRGFYLYE